MLQLVAIEIIQRIAYHTALISDGDTLRPPSGLLSLLVLNKSLHQLLDSASNPHLHAQIFRASFDFGALQRRFPLLTASILADELKRRWTVLKRVRARVHGPPFAWQSRRYRRAELLEDMMTMYLMFIESDIKNARLLFRYALVQEYVAQYRGYRLEPVHRNPQMPEEKEETALFLWLSWFSLDHVASLSEPAGSRANFEWLLMPYARGTFKYANAFASSNKAYLPETRTLSGTFTFSLHPDYREVRPPSEAFPPETGYLGLTLSPPLAHHAAILLWTARQQDRLEISTTELLAAALQAGPRPSISALAEKDLFSFPEGATTYTPEYMRTCYATVSESALWDQDWKRMHRWTPGTLSGIWDGIFLLPVLDDWIRIRDTLSFPDNPNDTNNRQVGMAQPTENTLNVLEESAINNMRTQQSWSVQEYHFNAHFSPRGAKPISSENVDPSYGHLPKTFSIVRINESKWSESQKCWIHGVMVKENAQSIPAFYEAIPAGSALEVTDSPRSIQTIVLGSRTSPPTFVPERNQMFSPGSLFYGVVRHWDGLITLRFDSPANRMRDGEWTYQGYVINCSNWLGRWREAHTTNGFESAPYGGVFCMSRRRAI